MYTFSRTSLCRRKILKRVILALWHLFPSLRAKMRRYVYRRMKHGSSKHGSYRCVFRECNTTMFVIYIWNVCDGIFSKKKYYTFSFSNLDRNVAFVHFILTEYI